MLGKDLHHTTTISSSQVNNQHYSSKRSTKYINRKQYSTELSVKDVNSDTGSDKNVSADVKNHYSTKHFEKLITNYLQSKHNLTTEHVTDNKDVIKSKLILPVVNEDEDKTDTVLGAQLDIVTRDSLHGPGET